MNDSERLQQQRAEFVDQSEQLMNRLAILVQQSSNKEFRAMVNSLYGTFLSTLPVIGAINDARNLASEMKDYLQGSAATQMQAFADLYAEYAVLQQYVDDIDRGVGLDRFLGTSS